MAAQGRDLSYRFATGGVSRLLARRSVVSLLYEMEDLRNLALRFNSPHACHRSLCSTD